MIGDFDQAAVLTNLMRRAIQKRQPLQHAVNVVFQFCQQLPDFEKHVAVELAKAIHRQFVNRLAEFQYAYRVHWHRALPAEVGA